MRGIIINTSFEGTHCYPSAPEEVAFLKNPHRHIFHVNIEIEVFHDDRELEFILVKRNINSWIKDQGNDLFNLSCEMIAERIQLHIKGEFPMDQINKYGARRLGKSDPIDTRLVNVIVMEDNENGGFIKEW